MLPFFVLICYVCKLSLTSQFGNRSLLLLFFSTFLSLVWGGGGETGVKRNMNREIDALQRLRAKRFHHSAWDTFFSRLPAFYNVMSRNG